MILQSDMSVNCSCPDASALTILGRGYSVGLLKEPVEVLNILISDLTRYGLYALTRILEQCFGTLKSLDADHILEGLACFILDVF